VALALLAGAGLAVRGVVVVQQRGGLRVDDQDDVTAVPAVAGVRADVGIEVMVLNLV
jgi:hypothetical protein